jgi:integrase/recombinase XerC
MPSSLPEHVAEHLEWMRQRGLAASYIDKRRLVLARLAAALPVPLTGATPGMLGAWRATLVMGDDAVCNTLGAVREFYKWATGRGLTGASPAAGLPVPRRSRHLPRPIATHDLFSALACAPPRIRQWLVLAAWCGLRACEIARLQRANVLDTASPPVLRIVAGATKGRRERIIPLSSFVLGELFAHGMPASGWMFRRADGKPGPNQPHRVSQLANAHLHGCGTAATLHQLRHWCGTEAYRPKRDLRMVQELLGHANIASTAGYTAYFADEAAAALEQLPVPGPGWPGLRAAG